MSISIFYGCTTRANPNLKNNIDRVLEKIHENFIPTGIDICCGAPLLLSGHIDEAKKQAEKVIKFFKENDIDTVITPCPHCYTIIGKEYKEELGIDIPDIKVMHITQYIKGKIEDGTLKPKNKVDMKITYHDPCYIGRQGDRIYDEPREIIKSIEGLEFVELSYNKDTSTCCGGGGLLRAYLPRLAVEVAKEKIEYQVKPKNVDAIVSSCPFCYLNLKEGAENSGVEVFDLMELLKKSLEEDDGK